MLGGHTLYRTKDETKKRKDKKRQMILDVAARVFSAKGYYSTSVKTIVAEAGISVGSFYFYFRSKEDLFAELYRSIVKEFNDVTVGVIDTEHFSLLKNYTRVMIATLWMYEQKKDIARIMLREAVSADRTFGTMEEDRKKEFAQTMTEWFSKFKAHKEVNMPDERVAALIYTNSYYGLINDWLSTDGSVSLTSYGYAFCVYNLQALRIPFTDKEINEYIKEVLDELDLLRQE